MRLHYTRVVCERNSRRQFRLNLILRRFRFRTGAAQWNRRGLGRPLPSRASQLGWAEVTYDHLKRAALLRNLRFHMEFPIKIHCIRLPMSFQFQIGRQIARRLVCFTFGHRVRSSCRCNIIPIGLVIFFFFFPLKFENRRIRWDIEDIFLFSNAKKDLLFICFHEIITFSTCFVFKKSNNYCNDSYRRQTES